MVPQVHLRPMMSYRTVAGHTARRLGILLVGMALVAACDHPGDDAKSNTPAPMPIGTPPLPRSREEWLYGESVDKSGSRAWFVQFGTDSASVYDPPGITQMCRDHVVRTDVIRWHAELGPASQPYRIDEILQSGALGMMVRAIDSKSAGADSSRIMLRPIVSGANRTPPSHTDRSGVYSSLSTSAETGDVVGSELIVAETSSGLAGALVLGEGAASQPYTLREITFAHDTMRFTTTTEVGPIKYIAQIGPRAAVLWVAGDTAPEVLARRGSTIDFLRRVRARSCRT